MKIYKKKILLKSKDVITRLFYVSTSGEDSKGMSLTLYTFVRLIFEGGLYSFFSPFGVASIQEGLLFKRGFYSRAPYNSENTVVLVN